MRIAKYGAALLTTCSALRARQLMTCTELVWG